MFTMSYGYNPTTQQPIDPGPVGGTIVDPVTPPLAAHSFVTTEVVRTYGRAMERRRRPVDSRRVIDYLGTIQRRVADTNQRFALQGLPYRFNVHSGNGGKVMLDLEAMDAQGGVVSTRSRNITDENFGRLMDDISSGTGLVIDSLPPPRSEPAV